MTRIEVENNIIKKPLEEATYIASSNGFYLRIVWEDNTYFFGTCDMDENRIDIYVKNNIIINKEEIYDEGLY